VNVVSKPDEIDMRSQPQLIAHGFQICAIRSVADNIQHEVRLFVGDDPYGAHQRPLVFRRIRYAGDVHRSAEQLSTRPTGERESLQIDAIANDFDFSLRDLLSGQCYVSRILRYGDNLARSHAARRLASTHLRMCG